MDLTHNEADFLANISVFRRKCSICGHLNWESLEQDVKEIWGACECGHIFPMSNETRWQ